jgi:hypothetical protein
MTIHATAPDPGDQPNDAGEPGGSCCSSAEQATCCEPSAKSTCCGAEATTAGGCGCR